MPNDRIEAELAQAHEATSNRISFTYFRTVVFAHFAPDFSDDPVAIIFNGTVHYMNQADRDLLAVYDRLTLTGMASRLQKLLTGEPEFQPEAPDPNLANLTTTRC